MAGEIITWIALTVVGVAALLFSVALLGAYLERRGLVPMQPVDAGSQTERRGAAGSAIAAAEALDFRHVGYFREASGWVRERVTLLLSADGLVLAEVYHGMSSRVRLDSKLADGRWLVTGDKPGEPDLSGLRVGEHWPGPFPEILARHRRRLAEMRLAPVAFDTGRANEELLEHARAHAKVLIAAGQARWRGRDEAAWSYTLPASFRIATMFINVVQAGIQREQQAERERKQRGGLPRL